MNQPKIEYKLTCVMQDNKLTNIPATTAGTMKEVNSYLRRQSKDNVYQLTTIVTTRIDDPSLYEGGRQ